MAKRLGQYQPAGQWITRERRLAIYIRDNFQCLYCGTDLRGAAPADVTLDHVICRADGGGNESINLVTACRSCNSARGAKTVTDYAPGGALERIEKQLKIEVNVPLAKAIIKGTAGDPRLESER